MYMEHISLCFLVVVVPYKRLEKIVSQLVFFPKGLNQYPISLVRIILMV
jgi:hypothetical protein